MMNWEKANVLASPQEIATTSARRSSHSLHSLNGRETTKAATSDTRALLKSQSRRRIGAKREIERSINRNKTERGGDSGEFLLEGVGNGEVSHLPGFQVK